MREGVLASELRRGSYPMRRFDEAPEYGVLRGVDGEPIKVVFAPAPDRPDATQYGGEVAKARKLQGKC